MDGMTREMMADLLLLTDGGI
jgi:hypothetical protein